MKKLLLLLITISLLSACKTEKVQESNANDHKSEISLISKDINDDLLQIRQDVEELASFTETLYDHKTDYIPNNPDIYTISESGVMYKTHNDGKSAIFVSGYKAITDEVKQIVYATEPLDTVMEKIVEQREEVVQAYYNDCNSYNRIYPFFEVLTQYEPMLDIPSFNFYYLADEKHNPGRMGTWVKEPYVDPAGRGWMVSAIAPVYVDDKLVGVPGLDVTIQTITSKYITSKDLFIIDEKGVVVAADEFVIKLLSLPDLVNHKYFETIKSDTYLKDKYNVLKHKDKKIRNMFAKMLIDGQTSQKIDLQNVSYHLICTDIEELGWKLFKVY